MMLVFDLEGRKDPGSGDVLLSVGSFWTDWKNETVRFTDTDPSEFLMELENADLIVGFGLFGFDYNILEKSPYDVNVRECGRRTFDVFVDIAKKTGEDIGLDYVAIPTLGRGKMKVSSKTSGEMWNSGEIEYFQMYNERDTELARDVFFHGYHNGNVSIVRHLWQPYIDEEEPDAWRWADMSNYSETIDVLDWQDTVAKLSRSGGI